ncbi:MAG TPA: hypothetical protein VGM01_02955 [Ktedonobacteraceae bacterium]
MPDHITQQKADNEQETLNVFELNEEHSAIETVRGSLNPGGISSAGPTATENKGIWTPRFLLIFAITLVLGVSADSLLTSAWSTGLITGDGSLLILGHCILVALGWLVLGIVTRSRWVRIGCIFGGICTAFLILNVFTVIFGVDSNSPAQSYINVATCTALLGAYIGLSIEGTLLSAWDFWLFLLITVLGSAGVSLTYLLTPQASILTSENAVAAAALIAACLVWWARPSCWKKCPGPTFIFGIVPVIQLLMALVNGSLRNLFFLQVLLPRISTYANINNFFFAQFILLCLLLGCMRLTKSEIHN